MNRLSEYVELSRFTSDILEPIQEVFTSREVDNEQAKMRKAYKRFVAHHRELRRDLERHVDRAIATPLLEDLEMIHEPVAKTVEKGERRDEPSFPIDIHLSEIQLGEQRLLTGILSDGTERQQTVLLCLKA